MAKIKFDPVLSKFTGPGLADWKRLQKLEDKGVNVKVKLDFDATSGGGYKKLQKLQESGLQLKTSIKLVGTDFNKIEKWIKDGITVKMRFTGIPANNALSGRNRSPASQRPENLPLTNVSKAQVNFLSRFLRATSPDASGLPSESYVNNTLTSRGLRSNFAELQRRRDTDAALRERHAELEHKDLLRTENQRKINAARFAKTQEQTALYYGRIAQGNISRTLANQKLVTRQEDAVIKQVEADHKLQLNQAKKQQAAIKKSISGSERYFRDEFTASGRVISTNDFKRRFDERQVQKDFTASSQVFRTNQQVNRDREREADRDLKNSQKYINQSRSGINSGDALLKKQSRDEARLKQARDYVARSSSFSNLEEVREEATFKFNLSPGQLGVTRPRKFIDHKRITQSPEAKSDLFLAGLVGGPVAFAGGALGGSIVPGRAGIAGGALAAEAIIGTIVEAGKFLADTLFRVGESGLEFERSLLGIGAVGQATSRFVDKSGKALPISDQIELQQQRARQIQTGARAKLLPLGIAGEREATLVQAITAGTSQKGVILTPDQIATLSERIGAAVQAQRPELLNNPAQLRRDVEDLLSGLPVRTVLKAVISGFAPGLSKATTGSEYIRASEGLKPFVTALTNDSGNAAIAVGRLSGSLDQLTTTIGSEVITAFVPAIQEVTKVLSDPELIESLTSLAGGLSRFFGSIIKFAASPIGKLLIQSADSLDPSKSKKSGETIAEKDFNRLINDFINPKTIDSEQERVDRAKYFSSHRMSPTEKLRELIETGGKSFFKPSYEEAKRKFAISKDEQSQKTPAQQIKEDKDFASRQLLFLQKAFKGYKQINPKADFIKVEEAIDDLVKNSDDLTSQSILARIKKIYEKIDEQVKKANDQFRVEALPTKQLEEVLRRAFPDVDDLASFAQPGSASISKSSRAQRRALNEIDKILPTLGSQFDQAKTETEKKLKLAQAEFAKSTNPNKRFALEETIENLKKSLEELNKNIEGNKAVNNSRFGRSILSSRVLEAEKAAKIGLIDTDTISGSRKAAQLTLGSLPKEIKEAVFQRDFAKQKLAAAEKSGIKADIDAADTLLQEAEQKLADKRKEGFQAIQSLISAEDRLTQKKIDATDSFTFTGQRDTNLLRMANAVTQIATINEKLRSTDLTDDERNELILDRDVRRNQGRQAERDERFRPARQALTEFGGKTATQDFKAAQISANLQLKKVARSLGQYDHSVQDAYLAIDELTLKIRNSPLTNEAKRISAAEKLTSVDPNAGLPVGVDPSLVRGSPLFNEEYRKRFDRQLAYAEADETDLGNQRSDLNNEIQLSEAKGKLSDLPLEREAQKQDLITIPLALKAQEANLKMQLAELEEMKGNTAAANDLLSQIVRLLGGTPSNRAGGIIGGSVPGSAFGDAIGGGTENPTGGGAPVPGNRTPIGPTERPDWILPGDPRWIENRPAFQPTVDDGNGGSITIDDALIKKHGGAREAIQAQIQRDRKNGKRTPQVVQQIRDESIYKGPDQPPGRVPTEEEIDSILAKNKEDTEGTVVPRRKNPLLSQPDVSKVNTGRFDKIFQKNDASEGLINKLKTEFGGLPEELQKFVEGHGLTISAGSTHTKVFPKLASQKPYGDYEGKTFDDVLALTGKSNINFNEKVVGEEAEKGHDRIGGTLKHELGHLLDKNLFLKSNASSSKDFQDAYADDMSELGKAGKPVRKHFSAPGGKGQQEVFAELLADFYGGRGSSPEDYRPDFPKSYAIVKKLLEVKLGSKEFNKGDLNEASGDEQADLFGDDLSSRKDVQDYLDNAFTTEKTRPDNGLNIDAPVLNKKGHPHWFDLSPGEMYISPEDGTRGDQETQHLDYSLLENPGLRELSDSDINMSKRSASGAPIAAANLAAFASGIPSKYKLDQVNRTSPSGIGPGNINLAADLFAAASGSVDPSSMPKAGIRRKGNQFKGDVFEQEVPAFGEQDSGPTAPTNAEENSARITAEIVKALGPDAIVKAIESLNIGLENAVANALSKHL